MVAIIRSGKSIRKTLNYNEQKVRQNVAELILARNFSKDTKQLGFTDKLRTFEKLTSLNERTTLNSVHISLNFDPSEKLDKETLRRIAEEYMNGIGFGEQPYLIYQHHDSGHPHIHVVTTNIEPSGRRIAMQNIGRNQSEITRKKIENDFNLKPAQKNNPGQIQEIKPVSAQRIQYGKSTTKNAISNVLQYVLPNYKYGTIAELNAVLKLFNVTADRGSAESRTYKNNGLVYQVLDDQGKGIGKPVKASDFHYNPGMKYLEDRFKENVLLKQPHKLRVKNAIDLTFSRIPGATLDVVISALQKENITVVVRQNADGVIYGLTYVDHQTKTVFNGSELGKAYSANQMQERCHQKAFSTPKQQPVLKSKPPPANPSAQQQNSHPSQTAVMPKSSVLGDIFKDLTDTEFQGFVPRELKDEVNNKKRKKKRQKH